MKLIIGLGNPGNQYNFTRHNTGFLALDFYFKTHKLEWEGKPKFGAIFARVDDTFFIKPQDFYNESGRAVREFVKFYKMNLSDILVVCDDFNLEFCKIRTRATGSAGGNNGLKSIIAELGTEDFCRVGYRCGIGIVSAFMDRCWHFGKDVCQCLEGYCASLGRCVGNLIGGQSGQRIGTAFRCVDSRLYVEYFHRSG